MLFRNFILITLVWFASCLIAILASANVAAIVFYGGSGFDMVQFRASLVAILLNLGQLSVVVLPAYFLLYVFCVRKSSMRSLAQIGLATLCLVVPTVNYNTLSHDPIVFSGILIGCGLSSLYVFQLAKG
jgi:hypothetical protein